MNRLTPLTLTLLIILCPLNARLVNADRPNIVLVMADDQGWGDMAYRGHPALETPNFDAAASAGLRFERFYAAAPVCSPTRGSVMTGRHPNRYGVFKWGHPIRPQEVTIAEALNKAGYVTGHFGKWHLGSVRCDSPVHPGRNGFDMWVSAPNFFDNDPILCNRGTAIQLMGESSMVTVDLALKWMQEVQQDQRPFLAVIWFGSPHAPHRASDVDRRHYADYSKEVRDFYGEITGMDRAFGKLRNALRREKRHENTILWYCSDNGALRGIGSAGGRRGHKGTLYEGGLLVPAFLEWPRRIKSACITHHRCNSSDIYPTLLEVADVPLPQIPLDGMSLVHLLDGQAHVRNRPMGFWDYPTAGIRTPSAEWMSELLAAQRRGQDLPAAESSQQAANLPDSMDAYDGFPGHAAWIDGDWKLHRLWHGRDNMQWELYDLANDPNETTNLLADHPERVRAMRTDLEDWLESVVNSLAGSDYKRVNVDESR